MRSHNTSTLKTRGFGLSGVSIFYISIIYIASLWAWLLLLIPLTHFFPLIKNNDWIVALPCLLVSVLLVLHLLSSFYTVTLTENMVVLSWLCIPLRRLSVDTLQLFCAVGNEREDVLCLTSRTIEEMALLEEKHLLRNYFTKYDVPLLKKKADWQDALAKKYLNRMRRSPLGIFRDRMMLFMTMNPVVQHQIHNLYTQLPYKNYTGITGYKVNAFFDNTTAPCFWMPIEPCSVKIQEDAVILYTQKEEKRRFLLRDIKTIVRVDIFKSYDRMFPHHVPVRFLSVYAPEELLPAARQLAARIARNAPIAVRACKAAMNEGTDLGMDEAMAAEVREFSGCFETEDQKRGMQGFLNKQKNIEFENK